MDGWKITRIIHGCPLLSKPMYTYIIFRDLGRCYAQLPFSESWPDSRCYPDVLECFMELTDGLHHTAEKKWLLQNEGCSNPRNN